MVCKTCGGRKTTLRREWFSRPLSGGYEAWVVRECMRCKGTGVDPDADEATDNTKQEATHGTLG